MDAAAGITEIEYLERFLPVSMQLRCFVAGVSDGSTLLHLLYDSVLEEKPPERLLALLRS